MWKITVPEPETFAYYEEMEEKHPAFHVVTWKEGFNYSAINNFGASFAKGEYLLLLNNDTELLEPDSIREMLGFCQREDVGIAGARLLYADDTIQHAGVVIRLWRYCRTYLYRSSQGRKQLFPQGNVCPGLQRRYCGLLND